MLGLALAASLTAQQSPVQSSPSVAPDPARRSGDLYTTGTEATKEQLKLSEQELGNEVTDANKMSKILGREVRNTTNERVGKVKDIVVDLKSGRIAYVVLSTGGMFSNGKLIAVPMDALTLKPGEEHFLIDAPKERLASAPGFSEDNWPKLSAAGGEKSIGLSASTDESTRQKAHEDKKDQADSSERNADRTPKHEEQPTSGVQPKR